MLTLKCDATNCCVLLFADRKSVEVAFAASSQCNSHFMLCDSLPALWVSLNWSEKKELVLSLWLWGVKKKFAFTDFCSLFSVHSVSKQKV